MEKSIRVRILNREYALRVEADNEPATREIAAYVDARMKMFQQMHPAQPELTTAVVAALSITEELYSRWEDQSHTVAALEQQLADLEQQLAAALSESSLRPQPDPTAQNEGGNSEMVKPDNEESLD